MEDMFSRRKPKAFYCTVNNSAIAGWELGPLTNLLTNENTALELDWINVLPLVERRIDGQNFGVFIFFS